MSRAYRFFYHYYKGKKKMSIHYRGACTVVNDIDCRVPCETKWNKTQPKLVMQGFAKNVTITRDNIAIIE